MAEVCARHNVKLLTYGTLVSSHIVLPVVPLKHPNLVWRLPRRWLARQGRTGFVLRIADSISAEGWLHPRQLIGGTSLRVPTQYLDMITRAWGSWSLFQDLLQELRSIADKYDGMSIANVATRWVLDHPFVGAVIIGSKIFVHVGLPRQLTI